MPHPPVTVRQIAARTGLSPATVSHALRNSARVSARSREKVQKAAAALGWRPNPGVSMWMAHRRAAGTVYRGEQIAFLNCFLDLEFWRELPSHTRFVDGARRRADELGYKLEEFWFREPGMTSARMNRILRARGIRALIIGSAPSSHAHLQLPWENFALASQGYSLVHPDLSRAANDYAHSMSLLIHELRRLGYRRIGLHIWPQVDARCQRLLTGVFLSYQSVVSAAERLPVLHTEAADVRSLRRWLNRTDPEVVISHEIEMRCAIRDSGRAVPDEIGFAMYDLHPPPHRPRFSHANCAGVDMHVETAGACAIDLVATQLQMNEHGIPANPRIVLTKGRWVAGPSVRHLGRVAPLLHLPRFTSILKRGGAG